MAVLVTGGCGYIGSVTVDLLRWHAEEVVVVDDLSRGHRDAIDDDVPFYEGRICDGALVAQVVERHRIDACVHFAALTYVGESVEHPRRYFETNVCQTVALLGALVEAGVKRVVFSSTCATYGEPQRVPIDEDHPQHPANPYGWSKLMVERAMASYDAAYGLRYVALRYFNAAGATSARGERHDPETHLIPLVLEAALGDRPHVSVFGQDYPTPDGTAIRDYIHVTDLATAHQLALAHLRGGGASEAINLGNGQGHSVREVIDTVSRVTGRDVPVRMEGRRAGDPARLVAQADKARRVLGWTPRHPNLEDIVRSAWSWRSQQADRLAARLPRP